MKRPRTSLASLGALMAVLAAAGPAAGIAPRDPHRRAFAEALKGKPKKPKWFEPDGGRWTHWKPSVKRAERRRWGRDFAARIGLAARRPGSAEYRQLIHRGKQGCSCQRKST